MGFTKSRIGSDFSIGRDEKRMSFRESFAPESLTEMERDAVPRSLFRLARSIVDTAHWLPDVRVIPAGRGHLSPCAGIQIVINNNPDTRVTGGKYVRAREFDPHKVDINVPDGQPTLVLTLHDIHKTRINTILHELWHYLYLEHFFGNPHTQSLVKSTLDEISIPGYHELCEATGWRHGPLRKPSRYLDCPEYESLKEEVDIVRGLVSRVPEWRSNIDLRVRVQRCLEASDPEEILARNYVKWVCYRAKRRINDLRWCRQCKDFDEIIAQCSNILSDAESEQEKAGEVPVYWPKLYTGPGTGGGTDFYNRIFSSYAIENFQGLLRPINFTEDLVFRMQTSKRIKL